MTKPKSYFAERMEQIGIDPENVPTFKIVSEQGTKHETESARPYFAQDAKGSVLINFPDLFKPRQQSYTTDAERWATDSFTRTRNHPNLHGRPKYSSRKGSGVKLFYTPLVLEAAQNQTPIENLVVVEGEFKAWALYHFYNIPAIGLTGITGFREKGAKEIHPDLQRLFDTCKVNNLILLHDADATAPNWEKWKADKNHDLGRRLNSFFHSVIDFYELTAARVGEVYYTRIKESYNAQNAKGVDDLINKFYENSEAFEQIKTELLERKAEGTFFEAVNLTKNGRGAKLRTNIFLLPVGRNNPPDAFYTKYESIIDNSEFTFLRGRYVWNDVEGKLQMQQHPEAEQFIRIGCDYFKVIYRPVANDKGKVERKLEAWKSAAITQDYVKEKGLKEFFNWIPKFDASVNIPENNPKAYRQAIEVTGEGGRTSVCYNLYHRLEHQPEAGEWPTIEGYLKHIFRGKETLKAVAPEPHTGIQVGDEITADRYQMALDYLQLLYTKPTQKLPIIALLSTEQHTGKTTFLNFVCAIFQENSVLVGNQEITDRFNDDYASKLVICLDEGLIEKKVTFEKIKSWSTSDKISIEAKNVSRQSVGFFGKIIMTGNRERNLLPLDQNDSRFWVTKVHEFTGAENPDLLADMKKEIPAFLHFLLSRKIHYPKCTRHWFSYNLLESAAKDKLKGGSKEWIQSEFEAWLKEQFLDRYLWPEVYFSITEIAEGLNNSSSGVKFRKAAITELLEHTYKLSAKNSSYQMPHPVHNGTRQTPIAGGGATETVKGRKYTFTAEEFLNSEELAEIKAFNTKQPEPETANIHDLDNLEPEF